MCSVRTDVNTDLFLFPQICKSSFALCGLSKMVSYLVYR